MAAVCRLHVCNTLPTSVLCAQSVADDEPLIGRFKSVFNLWKKKDSENGRVQRSQPSVAGD
jgi:hypothetical protein